MIVEEGSKRPGVSINVNGLKKTFNKGSVEALCGISLDFEPGLLHGVIGPAGAGKTTLIRLLMSLLDADLGSITYYSDGRPTNFEDVVPFAAYMPEKQSLYADLSIDEHLEFFSSMYGIHGDEYETKRKSLLERTNLE
jgi:ABC-2 type transport system ATP-binding protein